MGWILLHCLFWVIPYFATITVELNWGWTHIFYVVLEAIPFTVAVLCFLLFFSPQIDFSFTCIVWRKEQRKVLWDSVKQHGTSSEGELLSLHAEPEQHFWRNTKSGSALSFPGYSLPVSNELYQGCFLRQSWCSSDIFVPSVSEKIIKKKLKNN